MHLNKQIWQLLACILALKMIFAYPLSFEQHSQRLSAETALNIGYPLSEHQQFENLYSLERTLGRLRRAVEQFTYEDSADDLELAEVNLFRPLFRYRAEVSRQVKNQQQQQQF